MIDKDILIKSVKNALKEDKVNKDLTHKVLGNEAIKKINAVLTNKEELILSGIDWFNHSFKLIDKSIKIKFLANIKSKIKTTGEISMLPKFGKKFLIGLKRGSVSL